VSPRSSGSSTTTGTSMPVGSQRRARERQEAPGRLSRGQAGHGTTSGNGDRLHVDEHPLGALAPLTRVPPREPPLHDLPQLPGELGQLVDGELQHDVGVLRRTHPRAWPVAPRRVPLLQRVGLRAQPLPLEDGERGPPGLLVEEVLVVPRGQLVRGPPDPLAPRRLLRRLLHEAVPGKLPEVVRRRPAGLAEPSAELAGGGRAVGPQRAQQPHPQRVGQRSQGREVTPRSRLTADTDVRCPASELTGPPAWPPHFPRAARPGSP
jgi:hypothetical protein